MRCNLLTERPPETVSINGQEYPIRWDFRIGVQMEEIIRSNLPDEKKYEEILKLYYPRIPLDLGAALSKAIWFYRCGVEDESKEEKNGRQRYRRQRPKGPAWVFAQDAPYIYAAFREQYDMDITQTEQLHWWKFMALFESLGDDTKMSKIMYYRQVSTAGMPKDRRAFINEMKKYFRILDETPRMTLQQRDQRWKDYVKERYAQSKS